MPILVWDRGRVSADREKCAMAQGDLAVVADQQIEPEQRDGIDDHHRALESVIGAEHEGQREQHNSKRNERGGVDLGATHTRVTCEEADGRGAAQKLITKPHELPHGTH